MPQSPTRAAGADGEELRDYLSAWLAIGEMSRQGASWSGRERHNLFLNTADGRFADFSAASGADFPDDGRAVALSDWDADGDLDLWLAARTGPRVRFLRNRSGAGTDWVAFRLRGTRSNRDGIGARVRLVLGESGGGSRPPLVQTLRAGEGFLAQSSKWIHFGLPTAAEVEAVEVVWPGGELERFGGVTARARYLLEEGTGEAGRVAPRPPVDLTPVELETAIESGTSRIRLTSRPVMPPVDYRTFDATARRLVGGDGAVLVNLWASWCAPCVGELRDLERRREELAAAGLRVVALSVDEDPERARALLDSVRPGYEVGLISLASLDVLDVLQRSLQEERRRLALPTSFLLDGRGRLAVLYRGPLEVDDVLEDLAVLDLDEFSIRAATAPFPGRWATQTTPFSHAKLAGEMAAFGHEEVAALYRRLAAGTLPSSLSTDDPTGAALTAAFELLGRGRREEAEAKFGEILQQLANRLRQRPDDTAARNQLGLLLLGVNRPGAALQAFEQVLDQDPDNVPALSNAALLNWRGGSRERAHDLVERLSELDPAGAAELRRAMTANR